MNGPEFNEWLADYCKLFPDTANWLNKLEHRDPMLAAWLEAMQTVRLEDAKEVARRMLSGDYDRPKGYEREDIPATVKRLAARVRAVSGMPAKAAELPAYMRPIDPNQWSLAGVYSEIVKQLAEGRTVQEVADELIPAASDEDQPRYRCLDCNDSGVVTVWHTKAMKAMESGRFDEPGQRIAGVTRCPCQAGKRFEWMQVWFDPAKWVRCDDIKDPDSVTRLQLFMETRRPTGWTPEFADFNAR